MRSACGPQLRRACTGEASAGSRHRRLRAGRKGAATRGGAASGHLSRPEYRLAPPALESAGPAPRRFPHDPAPRAAPPSSATRFSSAVQLPSGVLRAVPPGRASAQFNDEPLGSATNHNNSLQMYMHPNGRARCPQWAATRSDAAVSSKPPYRFYGNRAILADSGCAAKNCSLTDCFFGGD